VKVVLIQGHKCNLDILNVHVYVIVELLNLSLKNAIALMGFGAGTSHIVSQRSTN
jgi:hypothetical protein